MQSSKTDRRNFIKAAAGAGLLLSAAGLAGVASACSSKPTVRIGFVGMGGRGTSMLRTALSLEGVVISAVCDIIPERAERAQRLVEQTGQKTPRAFTGAEDYKKMAEMNELDAIYTATPVDLHIPIMLAAMRGGKYGATEMGARIELDEAWELVETSEKTKKPCMLMENYAYMRNVMMVLNMTRAGLFGDLTHCACGYQHDARYVDFGPDGELLWRVKNWYKDHDGNPYPTHAIGPVAQWLNINRGNRFEYLVSMSSRSLGRNHYAAQKFGAEHPAATMKYAQGDVNTSLIQTHDGITVTLYHDVASPRPIDWIYRIQGTKGIYFGTLDKIFLEDYATSHRWEEIDEYREKYEHPLWKKYVEIAAASGHGGSDYLCFRDFVEAIRNRADTPIDVYDMVTWSIITKLTQDSVANRSCAIDFPDFTKGQWQTRKPLQIQEV